MEWKRPLGNIIIIPHPRDDERIGCWVTNEFNIVGDLFLALNHNYFDALQDNYRLDFILTLLSSGTLAEKSTLGTRLSIFDIQPRVAKPNY